jgi:protein TonB
MNRLLPLLVPALVLALAACAPTGTPPPPAAPESTAPPPAQPPVASAPARPLSPLDEYKQRIARRIVAVNGAHVYDGEPPHLLKSVTVVTVVIDARGNVTASRILRGNGHRSLERIALDSVKRAAPYDAPPRALLRGSSIEITETFLFRGDDKFQIRSIAQPQPEVPPEPDRAPPRRG